jgi:hypothetical protein
MCGGGGRVVVRAGARVLAAISRTSGCRPTRRRGLGGRMAFGLTILSRWEPTARSGGSHTRST